MKPKKTGKPPKLVLEAARAKLLLDLKDDEAGQVVKALVAYADTRALPEGFSGVLLFCFNALLNDIEQDWEKKASISEQNRRNAQKRWGDTDECDRMRPDANDADECDRMRPDANDASEYDRMRPNANDASECDRIPQDTREAAAPAEDFNPMNYLMQGEDGEAIVVYKHC